MNGKWIWEDDNQGLNDWVVFEKSLQSQRLSLQQYSRSQRTPNMSFGSTET